MEEKEDFLLHLEAYLAKRDGVDKLLKISRYATKIILSSTYIRHSSNLGPRLKAFESSVGVSRKAFRLGKFVQDVNALRSTRIESRSPIEQSICIVAYGGEGFYYFVEQFVWLSKSGLIDSGYARILQKISAWAELIGYVGSIALKVEELKKIRLKMQSVSVSGERESETCKSLEKKMVLKKLSIVQDLADGLMAIGDVRDGKGVLFSPIIMASAGLLSALISAQKNWASC